MRWTRLHLRCTSDEHGENHLLHLVSCTPFSALCCVVGSRCRSQATSAADAHLALLSITDAQGADGDGLHPAINPVLATRIGVNTKRPPIRVAGMGEAVADAARSGTTPPVRAKPTPHASKRPTLPLRPWAIPLPSLSVRALYLLLALYPSIGNH